MRQDRLALIADARLPGDARVMGLFVLELGEGWHEIPHDQFRAILDGPSDETLRRHLRKLEGTGWIEADSNTGRRPPRYRIRDATETPSGGFRAPVLASLPHTDVGEKGLPHTVEGETDVSPTPQRGRETSTPHRRGAEPPVVVGVEVVGGVGGEVAGAGELSERVTAAVNQEKLAGCRDSLRDYLSERVPNESRQWGYVQSVVSWIDGAEPWIWKLPNGTSLPDAEKPALVGAALNQLLASDERKMSRDVGDTGNLKTKIDVLLKQRGSRERRDGRSGPGTTRGEAPKPPLAAGQGKHVVEGGG